MVSCASQCAFLQSRCPSQKVRRSLTSSVASCSIMERNVSALSLRFSMNFLSIASFFTSSRGLLAAALALVFSVDIIILCGYCLVIIYVAGRHVPWFVLLVVGREIGGLFESGSVWRFLYERNSPGYLRPKWRLYDRNSMHN